MERRGRAVGTRTEQSLLAWLIDAGPYYTDGVRLFRLSAVVSGSNGPKLMQLEDCRTLHVSGFTAEEAALLELEPVRARSAAPDTESRVSACAARDGEHRHRARAHQA
jgi:hypothetical protein